MPDSTSPGAGATNPTFVAPGQPDSSALDFLGVLYGLTSNPIGTLASIPISGAGNPAQTISAGLGNMMTGIGQAGTVGAGTFGSAVGTQVGSGIKWGLIILALAVVVVEFGPELGERGAETALRARAAYRKHRQTYG